MMSESVSLYCAVILSRNDSASPDYVLRCAIQAINSDKRANKSGFGHE